MADLIVACSRTAGRPSSRDDAVRLARRLAPDTIAPREPLVLGSDGLAVVVANAQPGLPATSRGACVGAMLAPVDGWDQPGGFVPDGSYALCRFDQDRVELLTDALCSRSLWYVNDDETFYASTSQRVLVGLLGSYEPNSLAVSWLASSGSLGAEPWDRRLRRLGAATRLTLDRRTWTASISVHPVRGEGTQGPDSLHAERLRDAVLSACAGLDVDLDTWVLPLSGGMDSRTVLVALLAAGRHPRCVTWGRRASLADPASDASLAARVATGLGVEHEFLPLEPTGEAARTVLTRFVAAGEARTDQLAGYVDGFRVWKDLVDAGVAGVIRADEPPLGSHVHLHSHDYVRRRMHIRLIHDYPEGHLVRRLGLADQPEPVDACPSPGESVPAYRDRLYEAYSLPFTLGPLNDLKCKYMEVANPLMTATVLSVARDVPEHLRPGRAALRGVVESLGPAVPFAEHSSVGDADAFLHGSAVVDELAGVLSSRQAERVCPREGLDLVVERLLRPAGGERHGLRAVARATIPYSVRRRLVPHPPLSLGVSQLAFRLYLAARMDELLRDAGSCVTPGP